MNSQPWTWPLCPSGTVCGPEVRVMKGSMLHHQLPGAQVQPPRGACGRRGCGALPAAREDGDAGEHQDAPDAAGRVAWSPQLPPSSRLLLLHKRWLSRGLCPRCVLEALEVLGMAYPGVPGPAPSCRPPHHEGTPLCQASSLSDPAPSELLRRALLPRDGEGCGRMVLSSARSRFLDLCLPRELSGRWLLPPHLGRSETQAEGMALILGECWPLAVPFLASAQLQAWPVGGYSAGFR